MKFINLIALALISAMMFLSYQDISNADVLGDQTLKVKEGSEEQ